MAMQSVNNIQGIFQTLFLVFQREQ